jgi:hypothetical protein
MRQSALTYVKIVLAIVIVCGLSAYAYLQSKRYLTGPVITIESPINGSTITKNPLHITGTASNITFISLNDREITTDTAGHFDEILLLAPDYSIITFRARDRFGRELVKRLEVVYKETPATASSSPATTTVPVL